MSSRLFSMQRGPHGAFCGLIYITPLRQQRGTGADEGGRKMGMVQIRVTVPAVWVPCRAAARRRAPNPVGAGTTIRPADPASPKGYAEARERRPFYDCYPQGSVFEPCPQLRGKWPLAPRRGNNQRRALRTWTFGVGCWLLDVRFSFFDLSARRRPGAPLA